MERETTMPDIRKTPSTIQSVARAAAILKCFRGSAELGLADISRALGLHKSTAAGIIGTLKAEGFLEHNDRTGKLRLGLELFTLAAGARSDIKVLCEPHLNELLNVTGETVNLAVLDKTEVVYIDKKESEHSIRISTAIGTRLPAYCTAVGKSILAFMKPDKRDATLDNITFEPRTALTITDKDGFLAELARVKTEGVAYDIEEFEENVICVAAPLMYRQDNPIGAVSVSGPSMRMDEATRARIAQTLRDAAAQICGELSKMS
ncbi:MAG: IclR family transcriptional regulator [Oscillospiraceae bacterium]|jgi:DNA-binding IclR family transcriptional regulator|nr:IclR family transcriptional regulator [Oscillospiraceae bacterium]